MINVGSTYLHTLFKNENCFLCIISQTLVATDYIVSCILALV